MMFMMLLILIMLMMNLMMMMYMMIVQMTARQERSSKILRPQCLVCHPSLLLFALLPYRT